MWQLFILFIIFVFLKDLPPVAFAAIAIAIGVAIVVVFVKKNRETRAAQNYKALRDSAPMFRREYNLEKTDILNNNGTRRQAMLKKARTKLERSGYIFAHFADTGNRKLISISDYDVVGELPSVVTSDLAAFGFNEKTHNLNVDFVKFYEYINEANKTCLGCRVVIESKQVEF